MYGVPPDLPLALLIGRRLDLIGLGKFQISFHFDDGCRIDLSGRWELRDAADNLIDSACEPDLRECYRVHPLLGIDVANVSLDPPDSFTLTFASGYSLTVCDDTPEYESCVFTDTNGDLWVI